MDDLYLGLKMLGVSIHALQLTNMAPNHPVTSLPTIDLLGFYPSWEVLGAQIHILNSHSSCNI